MKKAYAFPALFTALAGALMIAAPAQAQTQHVKIAYLRAPQLVTHWHAEKMGLFKKEGIHAEILTVNNGPAVAAAVASGSADFGWAGSVPIIFARSQNQPFKVFVTAGVESAPDNWAVNIVASGRSGIKTVAELKGKTFVMNAVGAVCELQMRSHFKKAGIKFEDVKTIIAPFPQMAASLELGNGDAACPIEPFVTQMKLGGKINPVVLARGFIADLETKGPVPADAYFSTEAWLGKNPAIAAGFLRAMVAANKDLTSDLNKYRQYLMDEFKMPKDQADAVEIFINRGDQVARAALWQPLIDAMVDVGMLKQRMNAAELIHEIRN